MTGFRPDLRREPAPDLSDLADDPTVRERIHTEIRASGPMPFARFMELALYDPDGGYYRSSEARPGRGGDFITAPELHPIFGELLARAVDDAWTVLDRPAPFIVVEHGAGDGSLAIPMLQALPAKIAYHPVEVDERRLAALRERLVTAGLAGRLIEPLPTSPFDGIVVANEVLDALPVHRVRRRGDTLRELAVDLGADDAFVEVEIEPTTSALAERLTAEGVALVDGQTAEIALGLDAWVRNVAAPLRRGLVILIDYGAPAGELYDPIRRRDGTLQAYVRHRLNDPYQFVGRQDLTAHVDITAVQRAGAIAGLTPLGVTTQAEALMALGIEDRLREIQADASTTMEAYTLLRASLVRLLDPAAMGRFQVMVFGRGWPAEATPRLLGYRFARPTRAAD